MVASYIEDVALIARQKLSGLKQNGSLRYYVKKFTMIVWDIREMSERVGCFPKWIIMRSCKRTSMEWG